MTDMGQVISAVDQYADAQTAAKTATLEKALADQQGMTRAALDKVSELEAEVARLQAELDAQTEHPMWVGADVNIPGGTAKDNTLANFLDANRLIGPLTYRRFFPALGSVASVEGVKGNWDSGIRSVVSFAAPGGDYEGLATGKYNKQVETWAYNVASIPGVWATAIHEPEPKTSPDLFQAVHRQLYPVVKNANPDITWGPFYMTYWWLPAKLAGIGGASAWLVPDEYCDVRAADQYAIEPGPLETDAEFRGWYDNMPDTRPLALTEYGVYVVKPGAQPDPAKLNRRAEVLAADHAWLVEQGRFALVSYWHGKGSKGDWSLSDPGSQVAYRAIAKQGRTQ